MISARWRPKTCSSANEISPTVALARAASMASASRLPLPPAALRVSASSASATAFGSRSRLSRVELVDLQLPHRGVVDFEHVDRRFVARPVFVDADHRLRAGIDARLGARGGFLDAQLRQAGLDGARHAAEFLDFLDVAPGLFGKIVGEPLDIERAAPRIDRARGAALALQDDLRVAGDAGGKIGRQRQRLVERVGVQRLRAALRRRHRLDAGARDVVEHVLRGERPAGGLAMGAQRQRAFVAAD